MAHQAKLTVVPLIIAGGNYNFLFLYQKGAIFEGRQLFEEAIISNVSHRRSCPKYFVFYTSGELLNEGLFVTQDVNF